MSTISTPATVSEKDLAQAMKELGAEIRRVRDFRRMTRQTLYELTGVGVQTIIRIEDGSTGVAVLNLQKVMGALGMQAVGLPPNLPADSAMPAHERHLADEDVQEALEEATSAACNILNEMLGARKPERNGISSNFQGQLMKHLEAMLQGQPGAATPVQLKVLVYGDGAVGGPLYSADGEAQGWVLRLREGTGIVQDGRVMSLQAAGVDPYTSRSYALKGYRDHIREHGHLPGPVDAVPVYLDGEGQYRFEPQFRA